MRRRFYQVMWVTYVSIVGLSTLVAALRFVTGEDGTLHHFISTTSNHLVLVGSQRLYLCSFVKNVQHRLRPSFVTDLAGAHTY